MPESFLVPFPVWAPGFRQLFVFTVQYQRFYFWQLLCSQFVSPDYDVSRPTTMYPAAPEKNNLWYLGPWVLNYILMHAHLVQDPLRKLYK